jgi:transposase, IS30 family
MTKYHHLNRVQRYQIEALLGQSIKPEAIARQLSCNADTIKREIKRSIGADGLYRAEFAQASSDRRKVASRNARQITPEVWCQVEQHLALQLSPAQVAGRLSEQLKMRVCHESIYLHIYEQQQTHGRSIAHLRCSRKKRKKRCKASAAQRNQRGAIQNRVGIEERPAVVQEKCRIGDWEGDTMVGSRHLGGLLTMVDRFSRYTLAKALPRRCALPTCQAISEMLGPHKERCHTITLDNGSEFALHLDFGASLGAQVYFAKPHSPWQRGLNENTNGLLRQYFPKGSCMREITDQQVQHAVNRLNHRPRKCLGWRTPHEVFFNLPMIKLTL